MGKSCGGVRWQVEHSGVGAKIPRQMAYKKLPFFSLKQGNFCGLN
jgi:hypothetical protein